MVVCAHLSAAVGEMQKRALDLYGAGLTEGVSRPTWPLRAELKAMLNHL